MKVFGWGWRKEDHRRLNALSKMVREWVDIDIDTSKQLLVQLESIEDRLAALEGDMK